MCACVCVCVLCVFCVYFVCVVCVVWGQPPLRLLQTRLVERARSAAAPVEHKEGRASAVVQQAARERQRARGAHGLVLLRGRGRGVGGWCVAAAWGGGGSATGRGGNHSCLACQQIRRAQRRLAPPTASPRRRLPACGPIGMPGALQVLQVLRCTEGYGRQGPGCCCRPERSGSSSASSGALVHTLLQTISTPSLGPHSLMKVIIICACGAPFVGNGHPAGAAVPKQAESTTRGSRM